MEKKNISNRASGWDLKKISYSIYPRSNDLKLMVHRFKGSPSTAGYVKKATEVPHGLWIYWSALKSGSKVSEGKYRNGEKHGKWIFYKQNINLKWYFKGKEVTKSEFKRRSSKECKNNHIVLPPEPFGKLRARKFPRPRKQPAPIDRREDRE